MTTDESLTVLIPTFNGWHLLASCLNSLRSQTVPHEVLVVDDASTDATAGQIHHRFPEVELLVLERQHGFAAAVNRGLQQVRTPFVALLNNDTEVDPKWLESGMNAFRQHPSFHFFASRMLQTEDRQRLDGAGDCYDRRGMPYKRGYGLPAENYSRTEEVLGASAGAAFFRTQMLQTLGGFDEEFYMYLEDVDLSLRACLAGFRCRYLPEAIVYHLQAGSDPDRDVAGLAGCHSDRTVYWIARNRVLLMLTYQPLRHLPYLAFGWTKSLLFHLQKAGHTPAFLRGIGAGLTRAPSAARKRRKLRREYPHHWKELWSWMQRC